MSAAAWTYQPPHRPAGYSDQCYYRADALLTVAIDGASPKAPTLQVFRFANSTSTRLTVRRDDFDVGVELDAATLRALHAALGDALQDIAEVEADRERRESFERIQDEMRDADELGGLAWAVAHLSRSAS